MINCHDSSGKGIVFFLLVIYSGLGYSCNFNHNPISDDYTKKINTMAGYIPLKCQVKRPVIIPEQKEDQNCFHLLRLFLINDTLANIERHEGSELDKMIIGLQYEIYFLEECSFTIPPACPNEWVTIPTIFQNLNESLAALKPHIENNFAHCLRVKCAADGSSDQIGGNPSKQSKGTRNHISMIAGFSSLGIILILIMVVI